MNERIRDYRTTEGVPPQEDPRRPVLHGLGLDNHSLSVLGRVHEALRKQGYTKRELRVFMSHATSGDRAQLLGVCHMWCSLTGGNFTRVESRHEEVGEVLVMDDRGLVFEEKMEFKEVGVEIEVFVCGLCGHREESEHGISDQCMGCGACHDCCHCPETIEFYENQGEYGD